MAIWQFRFSLVPTAGILKTYGGLVDALPEYAQHDPNATVKEVSEFNNYWEGVDFSSPFMKSLESILPPRKSWSDDAKMFGSEDGNKIEVWNDDIVCSIDVRNFDIPFISSILEVARGMQCKVALKDGGRLIDPNLSDLLVEINNSRSMQFVQNPVDFLKNLGGA